MPKADANILLDSPLAAAKSRELTQQTNADTLPIALVDFSRDPNIDRPPDYFLYIYNIAPIEHRLFKPPLAPIFDIAACPVGDPYVCVARIPNIVNQKHVDAYTGQVHNTGTRGEALANDLLNPANSTNEPWREVNDWANVGTDLTVRGCFWSRENPPSATDLAKAKSRMEAHFQRLVEEGNMLFNSGKQNDISPDHHQAAMYFGLQTSWHRHYDAPVACPICGENIKSGVAFHRNEAGGVCVLNWERAVSAGVKTLADVPLAHRWKGPKWPAETTA